MTISRNSKILISHDWIEKFGGAEKVLSQFSTIFPKADVVTLWKDGDSSKEFSDVQQIFAIPPLFRKLKALLVPVIPFVWRRYRFTQVPELILCSSHLFAHFIPSKDRHGDAIPKYAYIHTPARYIWAPELDQRGNSLPVKLASLALKPLDKKIARESNSIAANSKYIQSRILSSWGAGSIVIYPPVDTKFFNQYSKWTSKALFEATGIEPGFVLAASRFVGYKQLDLVIRATAVANKRLVIAGQGPEENKLRNLASELCADVVFVISPDRDLLGALYASASVFVFPAVEDFGIMPVEAMAAGTPVIVNSEGGARESVLIGKTGATFLNGRLESLIQALNSNLSLNSSDCIAQANLFGEERFKREIENWVGLC